VDDAEPLDDSHGKINSGSHVVRSESAHESVKLCRRRADSKQERNFDENYEERACEAESSEENHDANMEEMGDA